MSEPVIDLPTDWDELLVARRGHFLQSRAWAHFQSALGQDIVWDKGDNWCWMGIVRRGRGVSYLYVPYGPTVQGDGLKACLASLAEHARELHLDFVRIEPMGETGETQLRNHNAQLVGSVQPKHTWVQDLSQDEQTLRSQVSSGHRNAINSVERNGVSMVRASGTDAVDAFLQFLHDTSSRNKFHAHPDHYFKTMLNVLMPMDAASLFYAYSEGKPVFGAITYQFNNTWYYAHAAGDNDLSRKLKVPPALVWHIMATAKDAGAQSFDFWGVNPPDQPNHPWAGLSQFKRAFGGHAVDYLGTWDIPVKPIKYAAYHIAKGVLPR